MATVTIKASEFESLITKDGITFIDFWADWCRPCKMFAPIFEKAADFHTEITFAKVDTESERELAAAVQITSIPTLMAFRDGIMVFRQPGALSESDFDRLILAVENLDMEMVKAEVLKEAGGANPR